MNGEPITKDKEKRRQRPPFFRREGKARQKTALSTSPPELKTERNKIKILLRSKEVCAIMELRTGGSAVLGHFWRAAAVFRLFCALCSIEGLSLMYSVRAVTIF